MATNLEPPGYVVDGVCRLYPNSYGWRRKVLRMPPHQVWGIYYDRVLPKQYAAEAALVALAKNSKVNDIWKDKEDTTHYHCTVCGADYKRDNPDMTHCEYCNSKFEEEIDYNEHT